ncbi:hypothetical protein DASC09_006470 [Saccharomycopsis crataegensis]|uniref:U4/U6.U5 small nuclear ribonucleoprotein 27kDa protein domain-containing protein n=1 Tax=Saccharomycopsis crataegensis TaxID=43959 RepID=A0AAV5QF82_9ASCO|nr:hypothetical protein DASC09_006470 [Saccharomycopsis crataegensis]
MSRNERVSRRDHFEREQSVITSQIPMVSDNEPNNNIPPQTTGRSRRPSNNTKHHDDRDVFKSKYTNEIRQRSSDRDSGAQHQRKKIIEHHDQQTNRNRRSSNSNCSGGSDEADTPRSKKFQEEADCKKRQQYTAADQPSESKNDTDDIDIKQPSTNDDDTMMMEMMGFSGFGSTKGKKVGGNNASAVGKDKAAGSFRQYMNRAKGFNRPLSPPPGERRRKN